MASGSSSLPWDFFSSRLLDLSPGSFRPHLSGSLALPTMTMTGTVGPVGPVGAVPTSRCSTGLPQSRGTSKGSRDLDSPWPWPQSVQSVHLDQVFVAKSKNSRPSSQSLSLARAHFWKTWRLDGLTFHAGSSLGGLGGAGPWWSQRFHRLFGKNVWWMLDHWLMAEGCWRMLKDAEGPRKINWIISNQTTMMWVQLKLWKTWFPTVPLAALGFQAVSLQGLRAKCIFKVWIFSLRPSVSSGAVRRRDTLLNFIAIDWVNEMTEMSLFWGPNSKKNTDIVISSIHITINIHWSLYIYIISISLTFAVHPFWERAMSAGSGWPKGGGAPRKHPAFGSSVLYWWTPGGEFSGLQRYIPIPLYNIKHTLLLFNIAMENCPFIDGLPIKNGDFPWLC